MEERGEEITQMEYEEEKKPTTTVGWLAGDVLRRLAAATAVLEGDAMEGGGGMERIVWVDAKLGPSSVCDAWL